MTRNLTDEEVLAAVSLQDEARDESGPELIILDKPLEWKGEQFTELHLREPTVHQVLYSSKVMGNRATRSTAYAAQVDLVARIAAWPAAAIDLLPVTVLDRAVVYVTDFEERGRRPDSDDPDLSPEMRLILSPAIHAVGQDHREMVLREPGVAQRKAYIARSARETPEAFLQAEIDMVAAISGWPTAAVLKMPIGKFARAADYLTGFFMRGPRIGPSYQLS